MVVVRMTNKQFKRKKTNLLIKRQPKLRGESGKYTLQALSLKRLNNDFP